MLTRLLVRNFKRFAELELELGSVVVFIGPNNSGKSSALEALTLWQLGVRRWVERRGMGLPERRRRAGVAVNRRDLVAAPVPRANLLWRDLRVRQSRRIAGKQHTQNIRIEIEVAGETRGRSWVCGLEFDYANEESFYCRPLRDGRGEMQAVPEEAAGVSVAFLPPMSELASSEVRLERGAVDVLIGQGRTAEVLRNLCLDVHLRDPEAWTRIVQKMARLFGIELEAPEFVEERGEIRMGYRERRGSILGPRFDLVSAGRGVQQTLLLLAYLEAHPHAVLLIDEPDAHLEILRQRQVYELLAEAAHERDGQIIAASHSEVILNEAAQRDVVIAFVGRPHRIDDRGSQVLKALREIGFEDYYLAEQTGWVLYLEGATDLAILRSFALRLEHPAAECLQRPFVRYMGNQPPQVERHFFGVREAKPDLIGFALYDRLERRPETRPGLRFHVWRRREIENYLCQPGTLREYAKALAGKGAGPLFETHERQRFLQVMEECIQRYAVPAALENPEDTWWENMKASDDFLDRVFARFFRELGMDNRMRKSDYHLLAAFVPREAIDPEVEEVLDAIVEVSAQARAQGA